MTTIKKTSQTNVYKDKNQLQLSDILGGHVKQYNYFGQQYTVS